MSLKGWEGNVALLPDVSQPDIYNYLVNMPSEYTHESMKVQKSLKVDEFFVCGHVHDVFYHQTDNNNNFCLVESNVLYQTVGKVVFFKDIVAGHLLL